MSELMHIDQEYSNWIKEIEKKFRECQIKAVIRVNEQMLKFYWLLGKGISDREQYNGYGKAFYASISSDLQREFPEVKSFSVTNLKYMRYFYELYSNYPQIGDDLEVNVNRPRVEDDSVSQVFMIPWGHNKLIIDKCKGNQKKALFYVHKTLENNWSRAVLLNFLDTGLYERQGKAITNFNALLPAVKSDLAQEMTRDPYNFDFLTLRENYDEKELKDALMQNVQNFLFELGTGFAFVGREYRLVVG